MNTDLKLRGSLKLLLQHFSLCVLWCCDSLFIISQRQQGSDHLRRVSLTDRWNDWDKSCHSSSEICLTTALNSAHYASSFFLMWTAQQCIYLITHIITVSVCVEHSSGNVCVHGERDRPGSGGGRQRALLLPASLSILLHWRGQRNRDCDENAGLWDDNRLSAHC